MIKKDVKIAIIGTGPFGTIIGNQLYKSGHRNIIFYSNSERETKELREGFNTKHFPNYCQFPKFNISNNFLEVFKDADYLFITGESRNIHVLFGQILGTIDTSMLVVNILTGIYPGLGTTVHQGLVEKSKLNNKIRGIVTLSSSSNAIEIALGHPTTVAALTQNHEQANEVIEMISVDNMKVYHQADMKGATAASAYSEVIAIATGILNGMELGANTVATLLTRAIFEMKEFVKIMGGKHRTTNGISGVGALIGNAIAGKSRSFLFGKGLATAENREEYVENNKYLGALLSLKFINKLSLEKNLNLKIIEGLYNCVFLGKDFQKEFDKAFSVSWTK